MSFAITGEIRGAGFRPPAKAIINCLRAGAALELVREPTNQYDANAVQVWCKPSAVHEEDREKLELELAGFGVTLEEFDEPPGWFLGYLGAPWAKELAPELDREGAVARATLRFSGAGKPEAVIEIE